MEEIQVEVPRAPNPNRVAAIARAREARAAKLAAKSDDVETTETKVSLDKIHEKTFWGNALTAAIVSCGINTPQKLNQAVQLADAALELYRNK